MRIKQSIKRNFFKVTAFILFCCTLIGSGAGIIGYAEDTIVWETPLATVTVADGIFGTIAAGQTLFSDRTHAFSESTPEWLLGKNYLQVSLSAEVTVTAQSAGWVYVITQTKGNDSQISTLTSAGFTRIGSIDKADFCSTLKYGVAVMAKEVGVGETVSYSKWGILVADFALDTQATVRVLSESASGNTAGVGEIIFAGGTHAFASTVPQGLLGKDYLSAPIKNGITAEVTADGWLYAITATDGNTNSQVSALEEQGFSLYATIDSKVLATSIKESLVVLAKQAVKGEIVSFQKWAILFGKDAASGVDLQDFASVTVGAGDVGMVTERETVFVDRTYTVASTADKGLQGKNFWKGYLNGGGVATVTADGWLYVLTPNSTYENSQASALEEQGFTEIAEFGSKMFSTELQEALTLFGKQVSVGDSVTFGKWGILLADVTVESVTNTPPTIIYNPTNEEYLDGNRLWQGIPGIAKDDESGRLWATWYSGGSGEGSYNWVVLYTSADDGKNWTGPKLVIDRDFPVRVFDPNLWIDPDGRMWLFWSQSYTHDDGIFGTWAMYTENPNDEDPTWSDPIRIANGVAMNDPIVLANGDWILPTAIWDISPKVEEYAAERYSNAYVSKDKGVTWSYLGSVPSYEGARNADENMIIEQPDGSLRMLIRTKLGIEESYSFDGGKTWSGATDAGITPVVSRFYIATLASGNQLLIYNDPPTGSSRSHMTAALSTDGGKTWAYKLVIDERSAVTYPDAYQDADGYIYIIYDHTRDVNGEIVMAKITEEDIVAGELVNNGSYLARLINNNMPKKEHPMLTGASVNLDSDLAIKYYVKLHNPAVLSEGELAIRFTMNGETVTVTDYVIVGGEYVFTFDGIAPQQMADLIDAEVLVGETVYATLEDYSIKQNCESLLAMSADALGLSDAKYAAMKQLVSDLFFYGEAAQDYRDYNLDAPITSDVEGLTPSAALPTESDAMTLTGNTDAFLHFTSATVRFDTVNSIVIKIYADVDDPTLVTVRVNGTSYTLSDLIYLGNGTYKLTTDGISAVNFDSVYTVELLYDGISVATIGYSVNAYAYAMCNGGTSNDEMKDLAEALYRYGVSAEAYRNAQ